MLVPHRTSHTDKHRPRDCPASFLVVVPFASDFPASIVLLLVLDVSVSVNVAVQPLVHQLVLQLASEEDGGPGECIQT